MFVVPRNDAVIAAKKIIATTVPVAPINRNVRRPKRSTYSAVHMFPMMVKLVQQAFNRRGLKPVRPRLAYIRTP